MDMLVGGLVSLGIMLLGTAIIGLSRLALSAFKEQKDKLADYHRCVDIKLKQIDETLVRLDTWREEHEKAGDQRIEDINTNIQSLREVLQNVLDRVLDTFH